jgi:hypothetical protein
MNSIH